MATQKFNIYDVLSETREITKTQFGHYSPLSLLFIIPLSISIVLYPILEHSLATTPHTRSDALFPFNGGPVVFKPLWLFLFYIFTLLCLYLCAIGTVTYCVYHGFSGQPVKYTCAIKSLSNSLVRLFATFSCLLLITLAGLAVICLIEFGVIRGIRYLGLETKCDTVAFWILYGMVLVLGFLYLNANWVLAPVIVVVESSWGLEPLRRSAYLVKGNRGVAARLLLSACVMPWLSMIVFGNWGVYFPLGFGYVIVAVGVAILSSNLLHILVANTIFYMKCKALQGEEKVTREDIADDFNREYVSLPLEEENAP